MNSFFSRQIWNFTNDLFNRSTEDAEKLLHHEFAILDPLNLPQYPDQDSDEDYKDERKTYFLMMMR
jgi:hypothetical protein